VAADLYYFRAMVLARSGRMEAVWRPLRRLWRPFGLRFTYVTPVLATKY
jgi:hypothetical protein